ncbi:MAG TPA: oligogalacturonate lyase family protein [Bacteroidales bacterium]
MKKYLCISLLAMSVAISTTNSLDAQNNPNGHGPIPNEWIDPSTGHKIIRLTRREGTNESFYFHNNPFIKSADGKSDEMVFNGSTDDGGQYFIVDLKTLEIRQLTSVPHGIRNELVARKNREVVYQAGDSVFGTNVDTRKTRLLFAFPKGFKGRISTLNADETLLAGVYTEGDRAQEIRKQYPNKGDYFTRIFDAHIPHTLFTANIKTGELKEVHKENTWLGHIQFSPVDPDLLMFCHEGPWEKVDRIWVENLRNGAVKLMHKRTMDHEIAGHEFWSWDGKTIWFDLQTPRSVNFNLGGVDYQTGKEVRYKHERNEWSIHYNISFDQKLFCGDGGDSSQVAKAKDGRWIYLFRPEGDRFKAEKLVNMKDQYYKLEPNVHFSPDGKWIIFRSNMFGLTNVFAVEIDKSTK